MVDHASIQVVILAGGKGARFNHETMFLPKPMIVVAGKPILQHIIDAFVAQGFRRFIIPVGHMHGHVIYHFETTLKYSMTRTPVEGGTRWYFERDGIHVTVVDTGYDSHTGERLWRIRPIIDGRFILTYGDGLSDVEMERVLNQHHYTDLVHGYPASAMVTLTAVHPPGRFGALRMESLRGSDKETRVESFHEKSADSWINGGFMVCEPTFFKLLDEGCELERGALVRCAEMGMLHAYRHLGYWRCMDTRRDLEQIEADVTANGGKLPWLPEV